LRGGKWGALGELIRARWIGASIVFLAAAVVWTHLSFAAVLFVCGLLAATRPENWRVALSPIASRPFLGAPAAVALAAGIAFSVYAAASGWWSPQRKPDLGLQVLLALAAGAGLAIELGRLRGRALRRLRLDFLIYAGLGLALLFSETLTGAALRGALPPKDLTPGRVDDFVDLGRGLTALIPSLFAAGAILSARVGASGPRRRAASMVVVAAASLAAIFAALRLGIAANAAGLVIGLGAAAAAWAAPRTTLAALGASAALCVIAAPLAAAALPAGDLAEAYPAAPLSWLQRLFIWRSAGDAILACLPFGCGADSARSLAAIPTNLVVPGAGAPMVLTPIHPHNVFLQIWLELGIPGAAFALAGAGAATRLLVRAKFARAVAAGIAGAGAATLVSFFVEASFWQVWRLAAIAIAAAGLALAHAAAEERS
jgi:hypothetical protein